MNLVDKYNQWIMEDKTILRKINAIAAVITSVLMMVHVTIMALLLGGFVHFAPWYKIVGYSFTGVFLIHVLLSIIVLFFCSEQGMTWRYASFQIRTIFQRLMAILIVILFHFHSNHYSVIVTDGSVTVAAPTMVMFMLEALLMLAVILHVAVSVPKALITLGITTSAKSIGCTAKICDIAGIMLAVFAFVCLCLYCF